MTISDHSAARAAARPPGTRSEAVTAHEAAGAAWGVAKTADDVAAARSLSRAAALLASIDADWLEELDAACIDAEARHAADLHAQAAARLRSAWAHPHPRQA